MTQFVRMPLRVPRMFMQAPLRATLIASLCACTMPARAETRIDIDTATPARAAAPAPAAATAYPAEAAGDGATKQGYNLSRWAEDWRHYRDDGLRDDPIDRLKYLPLADDGRVALTLSGELRVRMNLTTNPGLRESAAQRQDIHRIVAGADLRIGPHVRVFGELAHAGIGGRNIGTPSGAMKNDLVVQQLFGEANGRLGGTEIGLRAGRQEFVDGSNLLTSQRDNNSIRFVLNGVRAWARGRALRVDIFDFRLTALGTGGIGDDRIDNSRRFSGVTGGVVLPTAWFGGSKLYLDPFVWRLRDDSATWGGVDAREARLYAGARLWGEAGRLSLDWTLNHQGGSFGGRGIDAWQAMLAQSWRLGKAATAPRIGFHADYASGGGSYGSGTLHAATAPFGNNVYYSYQLALTPTNLVALAPSVSVAPLKGVRLTAEYQWSWRDSTTDAVYRANGTPFAGTERVAGRKVAEVARLQLIYTITPRLSFTARYEHLDAGPVLTRAGYGRSDFLAGWLSFRF